MIKNKPELQEDLKLDLKKGRFRRMRALVVKECFQIIRDPSSIFISIFLPLMLIFLFGSGLSLDLDHLKVGLVMEDTSPDAQSFAETLIASPYFDVKITRDRHALEDDLTSGRIRGFFVIPSYFSNFRARPEIIAPIQVIADGSETNTANFMQNYALGALQIWLKEQVITSGETTQERPIINIESRFWYNEELESRFFLLSGSLAIIMTLIGALLTALVVAREWERGTMEALISTTVSIKELVVAKVIPYFALGMLSMAICVFLSIVFYDLPLRGSFLVLSLISAIFLVCSLGLGVLVSTISKNQVYAYQITLFAAFLPAYILSGFLFEIYSMPKWIQLLTYLIPAKYFVQSLQALFLVGNVWKLILFDMLPIIGIGLVLFILTAKKTVKRLD